jgi:hypothetical protein
MLFRVRIAGSAVFINSPSITNLNCACAPISHIKRRILYRRQQNKEAETDCTVYFFTDNKNHFLFLFYLLLS